MSRIAAVLLLLLAGETASAHPGHGAPGWFHAHAEDVALVVLGLAVAVGLYLYARRR